MDWMDRTTNFAKRTQKQAAMNISEYQAFLCDFQEGSCGKLEFFATKGMLSFCINGFSFFYVDFGHGKCKFRG